MKNKIKILLIEDDRTTRLLLKKSLLKANDNLEFFEAWDKNTIIESLQKNTYDCILLDYFLPDTNAIKTMEYIKSKDITTPAIIISAQSSDTMAAMMIKNGAFDYISKKTIQENNYTEIILNSINKAINKQKKHDTEKKSLIALTLSEERYRGLIENSPILIIRFFYDDLLINFVNDGFCKYFEMQRYDVIGEMFYELIPGSSTENVKKLLNKIDFEHPIISTELSTKSIYGRQWQIWTFQGIFDNNNDIIEYQCMGEDITDQKISEIKLTDTLDEVQLLKTQQDGDYYLTTLLIDSLTTKNFKSDNIDIDFFIKSKKHFTFRDKTKGIGGDICITDEIHLKHKKYGVFVNGDAMGKSMQGAGGAMVLGAIIQATINKAKLSPSVQDQFPETWIKNSYFEFQSVFEQFQGSMLMSFIFGLVDDENGLIYYINAEHPWCVSYKNKKATFLEDELELWKLGVQIEKRPLRIKLKRLEYGEIFITGSDGRDDMVIQTDESSRVINDDENVFLDIVKDADGDIQKMYDLTNKIGEVTDDYSLLSIKTKRNLVPENNKKEKANKIKELLKNKNFTESEELIKNYIKQYPEETNYIYYYSYVLLRVGKIKKSIQSASRAILRDPNNITFLIHKAKIHLAMKRDELAAPIIQRINTIDPSNHDLDKLSEKYNISKIIKIESNYPVCYIDSAIDI